ncbi:MAG: hypothetical protein ACJAVX_003553 [Pseudoalteromonas rhizosphaerae]|jgi:hypothetical protein
MKLNSEQHGIYVSALKSIVGMKYSMQQQIGLGVSCH